MAAALEASGTGGGTGLYSGGNYDLTVDTSDANYMCVTLSWYSNTNYTITSITLDPGGAGQTFTNKASASNGQNGNDIWCLFEPSQSASITLRVTISGEPDEGLGIGWAALSGVGGTDVNDAVVDTATSNSGSTNNSGTMTTEVDGIAIGGTYSEESSDNSVSTTETEIVDNAYTGNPGTCVVGMSYKLTTTTTDSFQWSSLVGGASCWITLKAGAAAAAAASPKLGLLGVGR